MSTESHPTLKEFVAAEPLTAQQYLADVLAEGDEETIDAFISYIRVIDDTELQADLYKAALNHTDEQVRNRARSEFYAIVEGMPTVHSRPLLEQVLPGVIDEELREDLRRAFDSSREFELSDELTERLNVDYEQVSAEVTLMQDSEDPVIRRAAASMIDRLVDKPYSLEHLLGLYEKALSDSDEAVRYIVFIGLERFDGRHPAEALDMVKRGLADESPAVREEAAWKLEIVSQHLPEDAMAVLERYLDDPNEAVRKHILAALEHLAPVFPRRVYQIVRDKFENDTDEVARMAAHALSPLAGILPDKTLPLLREALDGDTMQMYAIRALSNLATRKPNETIELLEEVLQTTTVDFSLEDTVQVLAQSASERTEGLFEEMLEHDNHVVRLIAAKNLKLLDKRTPDGAHRLRLIALGDESEMVRRAAAL